MIQPDDTAPESQTPLSVDGLVAKLALDDGEQTDTVISGSNDIHEHGNAMTEALCDNDTIVNCADVTSSDAPAPQGEISIETITPCEEPVDVTVVESEMQECPSASEPDYDIDRVLDPCVVDDTVIVEEPPSVEGQDSSFTDDIEQDLTVYDVKLDSLIGDISSSETPIETPSSNDSNVSFAPTGHADGVKEGTAHGDITDQVNVAFETETELKIENDVSNKDESSDTIVILNSSPMTPSTNEHDQLASKTNTECGDEGSSDSASLTPMDLQSLEVSKADIPLTTETAEMPQKDADKSLSASESSARYSLDDHSDDTSRAAIALAAVAAAANAKHSSPSAAAEAARALVPGIFPEASMSRKPIARQNGREERYVHLNAVKRHLEQAGSESVVAQRLAKGENDAFLQYLLLLEYFRTDDVSTLVSDINENQLSSDKGSKTIDTPDKGEDAAAAAVRVRSILTLVEDAYDSVVKLLPPPSQLGEQENGVGEIDSVDISTHSLVSDLLPLCTTSSGDATVDFFNACSGISADKMNDELIEQEKDEIGGHEKSSVEDSVETDEDSSLSTRTSEGNGPSSNSPSMFSMFATVKRSGKGSPLRGGFSSVFRKRARGQGGGSQGDQKEKPSSTSRAVDADLGDGEYAVLIEREMLGLTVENVLERTIVRTVLPGGPAKKAGAKVGSLIVKVANVETKNLTHFETIDELRQSNRPLRLVMRQISNEALQLAREEMGRLIRGGGFGNFLDGGLWGDDNQNGSKHSSSTETRSLGRASKVEAFSHALRSRWNCNNTGAEDKKEVALLHAGEKLLWILTLLVIGLEREATKLLTISHREQSTDTASPQIDSNHHHVAKDFSDGAKSVARVLFDFVKAHLASTRKVRDETVLVSGAMDTAVGNSGFMTRRGAKGPAASSNRFGGKHQLGMAGGAQGSTGTLHSPKPLFRIGDVLQRTRTFLADTTSPPAALLRGEVIAFLCDILDIDTNMELSEEESASSTSGDNAGPINDLGSAGSLLKLIVLNCSMTSSPGSIDFPSADASDDGDDELTMGRRQRFGLKEQSSLSGTHRLHAGNRFLAVVHRLAASRSVSARVSACSLGPVLWSHLDFPHQLQLRGVITRALHDVDVGVRKSTATVLHEIAELVFDPRAVPWLVLMCERAMTDPEPQLRSAAMTLTWHLAEHLPNAFLGDASQGSRSLRRLPPRTDPTFAEVYLLQCKLLPVATRLAEDRAPSVRLAVAAQCDRLCHALGDHWSSVIIDVLQALLADADERVRAEAILCVPRLVETVLVTSTPDARPSGGVGVLEALLPVCIKLQKDTSGSVRVSLATSAGELLTLLVGIESLEEISLPSKNDSSSSLNSDGGTSFKRYKKHVDETLIPLLQQLLHDVDPEVTSSALRAVTNASRGNVREIRTRRNSTETEDDMVSLSSYQSHASIEKKDPVFIPVLSETQVLRLLPTLSELAKSRQWRVRQGAVEIVPALLGCTYKLQTRSEIAQLCIRLMSDRVDAVRQTAAECLCLGGGALGSHGEGSGGEWITAIVIPHLRSCGGSNDSKQRMLSLKMIEAILLNGVCPSKKVLQHVSDASSEKNLISPPHELLEVARCLSTDRIPNVRLNVGRVLGNVVHVFEADDLVLATRILQEQIDVEESRNGGGDRDVVFFAQRGISRAQTLLEDMSVSTQDESNRDCQ